MTRFYLGIDGGQSSTKALLGDDTGKVIGRGHGGPCNHVASAEGRGKFLSAVGDCLRQAYHEAGLESGAHFASVCLGLSGGSEDKEAYTKELIASDKYKFTHDAEIALLGGTAGEPGIIIIAGTRLAGTFKCKRRGPVAGGTFSAMKGAGLTSPVKR